MAAKPSLKDRIVACFIKDDRASLTQVLEDVERIESPPPARARDDDEHGMTHGGGVHLHLGGHGSGGDEGPPPWFKEHAESNDKRISDIEGTVGKLSEAFQAWANQEKGEPEHDAEEEEEPAGEKPPTEEIEGEIEEEAPEGSEEHGKKAEGEDAIPPEFKEHQKDDTTDESEEEEEEEKKPPPPKDKKRGKDKRKGKDKARDSAVLERAYQETVALAEVLAPGIQGPAFDRSLPAERTLASMREFRCRSLDLAYLNPATREIVENVVGKGKRALRVRDMKPSDLRTTFRAVGVAVKEHNNSRMRPTRDLLHQTAAPAPRGAIKTLGDYQKMLNDYYAPKA